MAPTVLGPSGSIADKNSGNGDNNNNQNEVNNNNNINNAINNPVVADPEPESVAMLGAADGSDKEVRGDMNEEDMEHVENFAADQIVVPVNPFAAAAAPCASAGACEVAAPRGILIEVPQGGTFRFKAPAAPKKARQVRRVMRGRYGSKARRLLFHRMSDFSAMPFPVQPARGGDGHGAEMRFRLSHGGCCAMTRRAAQPTPPPPSSSSSSLRRHLLLQNSRSAALAAVSANPPAGGAAALPFCDQYGTELSNQFNAMTISNNLKSLNTKAFWADLILDDSALDFSMADGRSGVHAGQTLSRKGPLIQALTIRCRKLHMRPQVEEMMALIPAHCSNILELTVDYEMMTEDIVDNICKKNKLRKVHLKEMQTRNFPSLLASLSALTTLEELRLSELKLANTTSIEENCFALSVLLSRNKSLIKIFITLSLNSIMVRTILKNTPALVKLELNLMDAENRVDASALEVGHRNLTQLTIRTDTDIIDNVWFYNILLKFPMLKRLSLHGVADNVSSMVKYEFGHRYEFVCSSNQVREIAL